MQAFTRLRRSDTELHGKRSTQLLVYLQARRNFTSSEMAAHQALIESLGNIVRFISLAITGMVSQSSHSQQPHGSASPECLLCALTAGILPSLWLASVGSSGEPVEALASDKSAGSPGGGGTTPDNGRVPDSKDSSHVCDPSEMLGPPMPSFQGTTVRGCGPANAGCSASAAPAPSRRADVRERQQ